MATLIVEIDDALLSKSLIDAQEQEIPLDKFISDALSVALTSPLTPSTNHKAVNVESVINSAVEGARRKDKGTEFMLVDICAGEDWDALSGGERKSLGKGFRKAVEGITPPIAEFVRRTSSNKAVYKRI